MSKYYAKYAVHNLLKDLLIETEEEMDDEDEDKVPLNVLIHELKLDKVLKNEKLELMMNPEVECNRR